MRTALLIASLLLQAGALYAQRPAKATAPPRTPGQILDNNRGAIAVIVAAGDTSTKLGTGFFVRSSGLLLTNFHVVEGTELVGVRIPTTSGVLWAKNAGGFDPDNDIVVLVVETENVRPALLGDLLAFQCM